MLQLERVIFSEGLLKIPPVLQRVVTEDVLNVAATYYSHKIEAERKRHTAQLVMFKASLKSIEVEKEPELYKATEERVEQTRDVLYTLQDYKEGILDPVSTTELTNFEDSIRDGYFILRYPLTENLLSQWYPGGKQVAIDLKNILTPTEYQKENDSIPTLMCFIEFKKKDYQGLYQKANPLGVYTINVTLPPIPNIEEKDNELQSVVDSLPTVIEHELGHFVQELLQVAKTNIPRREKAFRRFGYPSKTIQQSNSEFTTDRREWMDPHELRDIEFYTRLGDVRTRLVAGLENRKTDWNFERFKAFVGANQDTENFGGVDPWLKTLKDKAPGKYKKAVAELYKAVRDQYLF